jgi:O-antigen/teichoic acid export membrane protein
MDSAMPPQAAMRRVLARAASGTVALRVASLAATLGGSIVLTRALGVDGYGIYAYAFALVTLLALPSQAGLPTLLVRETARAQALQAWPRMRGLWRWSNRVIASTSVALPLLALAALAAGAWAAQPALRWTFATGLVLVPLIALGNARGAALRGLRHVVWGQLPETVLRPALLALLVLAAWAAGGRMAPQVAMAWHAAAAAVAFAFGAIVLRRLRPAELAGAPADTGPARAWWAAMLPLASVTGLQVIAAQTGVVMLGLFGEPAEVGLYKVAVSASALTVVGLQTANLVIGPHIAKLHAEGDLDGMQRAATMGAVASALATLPIALLLVFGGRGLLALLYGPEFVPAWGPLLVLVGGQLLNAAFGAVGTVLTMAGFERSVARWLVLSTAANVGLAALLVPRWGMLGAATASVAGLAIWCVAFWWLGWRRIGIDGSVFSVLRPRRARGRDDGAAR